MKFTERNNGLYLEGIKAKDIRFANLAGRPTGSEYDDPERPKHVYVLWLEEDIVQAFLDMNVRVKEMTELERVMNGRNEERKDEVMGNKALQKELAEIVRYAVQFKAYPKMRFNRRTGKEEQVPMAVLKTNDSMVRLTADKFGLIDSAHVENVDIRFHLYQYNDKKPDCVAAIDEIWVTVDESAGLVDDSYLAEKYGYSDDEDVTEEEIPFI